jgi:hypothetical protein
MQAGTDKGLSRRTLLRNSLALCVGGLPVLLACDGSAGQGSTPLAATGCGDLAGLSTSERALRDSLQYVDNSPHGSERRCLDCQFFQALSEGRCGSCNAVKGPIHADGHCSIWSPHPT